MSKEDIQTVFDTWNSKKVRGNPWRGCALDSNGKIPYEVKRAIRGALDHYPLFDVCRAIGNYALVLFDKQYRWTYAWKIGVFFTVKYEKRRDGEKKWWQFLPHNFCEADYLTKTAADYRKYVLKRRIAIAEAKRPPETIYKPKPVPPARDRQALKVAALKKAKEM